MQILSSGSFINLENQEKIEQLIFTAKEIANAAVETDGFVNEEENNKRLALEIWQGAEYMCRDHEEANIKNVFVNNFLERLRAIGGTSKMPSSLPKNSAGEFADDSPIENTAPRDEFLGFVSTAEEKGITETGSDANEIAEETKISEVFLPKVNAAASIEDENRDMEIVEPDEALLAAAAEIENAGQESEKAIEPSQVLENSTANAIQTENNVKSAVGALRLPEKEPYQFDKCTVTATIQLLPTDTEIRKAVLSVMRWAEGLPAPVGNFI